MWNQFKTDEYEGMLAETVTMAGHKGELISAYLSRPLGKGPFPGIVLIAHMPGWDEFYREMSRRFSQHGYLAICPDIFCRFGHGTPDEVSAKARAAGGVPDDSVIGDSDGAMKYLRNLPYSNSKVGVIGTCSGGRHAFLSACRVKGFNAAVECWGGPIGGGPLPGGPMPGGPMPGGPLPGGPMPSGPMPGGPMPSGPMPATKEGLPPPPQSAAAGIDYTSDLSCPLLGLFGNEDIHPSPQQVNQHEEVLKKFGKDYKFYRYDGAGHGFWYYHTEMYRPKQAMDAWNKVFEFFGKHLRS